MNGAPRLRKTLVTLSKSGWQRTNQQQDQDQDRALRKGFEGK